MCLFETARTSRCHQLAIVGEGLIWFRGRTTCAENLSSPISMGHFFARFLVRADACLATDVDEHDYTV